MWFLLVAIPYAAEKGAIKNGLYANTKKYQHLDALPLQWAANVFLMTQILSKLINISCRRKRRQKTYPPEPWHLPEFGVEFQVCVQAFLLRLSRVRDSYYSYSSYSYYLFYKIVGL